MCSKEDKKIKIITIKNNLGASNSMEYWKFEYPRFFNKNLCVKLNRLEMCSHENQSDDVKKPKRKLKSNDNSNFARVTRSKIKEIVNVDWARISNGNYRGDIAKVELLNERSNEAHLKLFPRINYDSFNGKLKEKTSKRRPLLKAFDPNVIR